MKIRLSEGFWDDFIELSVFIDGVMGYENVIANNLKV